MIEIEKLRAEISPEIKGLLSDLLSMPAQARLDCIRSRYALESGDVIELVKRINYILYYTPDDEQSQAYACITEAESGLHLAFDADNRASFDRMLKFIPPEKRIEEFMRVNTQNIPFIVRAINVAGDNDTKTQYFLDKVLASLTTDQLMTILHQRGFGGVLNLSVFFTAMFNPALIAYLIEKLSKDQLFEFCTLHDSAHMAPRHSIIFTLVKDYWTSYPAIKQSVRAILESLPYIERKKLMTHRDESGYSLLEWQEENFGYREMIEELLSKVFEISTLLDQYRDQFKESVENIGVLTSSAALLRSLEFIELDDALAALNSIDYKPDAQTYLANFEVLLLDRLQSRFKRNGTDFLHYTTQVNTLTNTMHYHLLRVLFDIQDLAELIERMSGGLTSVWQQIVIDIPDVFPEGLQATQKLRLFRRSKPLPVRLSGLESLKRFPPTLEALSMCVFSRVDGVMLNLESIKHYSFVQQRYIYKMLHANFPDLAQRVYQHNEAWRVLAEDIRYIEKAGITPKKALRRFIKGLRRGGENYSMNNEVANLASSNAIVRFMIFFENLPVELKNQLLDLKIKDGSKKFFDILALFDTNYCVEMLADLLENILYTHEEHPCMNILVGVSTDYLRQIDKKCECGLEVVQASDILHGAVPVDLAEKALKQLNFEDDSALFNTILYLPSELFDLCWRVFQVDDQAALMAKIFKSVRLEYFSGERKDKLLASIFNQFDHFDLSAQEVIYSNLLEQCLIALQTNAKLLPYLTSAKLVSELMRKSPLLRDFEHPLIYSLLEVSYNLLFALLPQINNPALYCELLELTVSADGVAVPVLFAYALCWPAHFEKLMTRFKEDESLADYRPRLQALFQVETTDRVLDMMLVKHPNIYLHYIDLFKRVVQQWANPLALASEEPRALKFH